MEVCLSDVKTRCVLKGDAGSCFGSSVYCVDSSRRYGGGRWTIQGFLCSFQGALYMCAELSWESVWLSIVYTWTLPISKLFLELLCFFPAEHSLFSSRFLDVVQVQDKLVGYLPILYCCTLKNCKTHSEKKTVKAFLLLNMQAPFSDLLMIPHLLKNNLGKS